MRIQILIVGFKRLKIKDSHLLETSLYIERYTKSTNTPDIWKTLIYFLEERSKILKVYLGNNTFNAKQRELFFL